jgi:uncharacterized protein (DUF1501 family)
MKRREFLKIAAGAFIWQLNPYLLPCARAGVNPSERILVLIELKGGNDGLNTLVPYTAKRYYQLRPGLAVKRDEVLPVSENLGLNPRLEALMDTWKQKQLAIVAGVGYPQPNRSHFRSIEIWETASSSSQYLQTGWLARILPEMPMPSRTIADGAAIGGDAGPLAGGNLRLVIMRNFKQFFRQAKRVQTVDAGTDNPALKHLLSVQNDLYRSARALDEKMKTQTLSNVEFPKTMIGRHLQTAARLIAGDIAIPVIKVSHGGFDNHANQRNLHDRLLQQLAEAMIAFRDVMQQIGRWEQVLVMTYSEFGRRPAENGSRGTDHGTAAPHFVMGGKIKGGLYGRQPSLQDLENDDLKFSVDYRSLYATVVRQWWGLGTKFLSGGSYPDIGFVG